MSDEVCMAGNESIEEKCAQLEKELTEAKEKLSVVECKFEELHKIMEPFYHSAIGDYNKWSMTKRDKKKSYTYVEAQEALRKYGRENKGK